MSSKCACRAASKLDEPWLAREKSNPCDLRADGDSSDDFVSLLLEFGEPSNNSSMRFAVRLSNASVWVRRVYSSRGERVLWDGLDGWYIVGWCTVNPSDRHKGIRERQESWTKGLTGLIFCDHTVIVGQVYN